MEVKYSMTEAGPLHRFHDAGGYEEFSGSAALRVAHGLEKRGARVEVWDGRRLVWEADPFLAPEERSVEEDEEEYRKVWHANALVQQIGALRGIETSHRAACRDDLVFGLYDVLVGWGRIPEPPAPGAAPERVGEAEAEVERALPWRDAELAMIYLMRYRHAETYAEEEEALREARRWIARAEEEKRAQVGGGSCLHDSQWVGTVGEAKLRKLEKDLARFEAEAREREEEAGRDSR